MQFHFLHAADIHLDRSLNGLRLGEDSPLWQAPRLAFAALVDEAIRARAAFLVLAGDIYDGAWKDSSTGLFFNRQMGRLRDAGIPVYLKYGNHDAIAAMPKTLHVPDNVHIFPSDAPRTFTIDEQQVALHGQSFRDADTRDNLVNRYPAPVPGMLNIGVLHTALEGTPPHAPYAPCSVGQLRAFGYDYWALGHVHGHKIHSQDPWIVFPGNLQGLHVNEPGARGAVRVSVADGRIQQVEQLFVDVLRWATLEVDLAGAAEPADAWQRLSTGLTELVRAADGRHLCARVVFAGNTKLHPWMVRNSQQVEDETRGQAIAVSDEITIEQVRVRTQDVAPPSRDHADAMSDLQGYLEQASSDPEFLASLRDALSPACAELAPSEDDRDAHPHIARVRDADFASLAASKKDELLYRIGDA